MTKYREILRLHSRGISKRSIAISCECSRNTVAKVLERAKQLSMGWPLNSDMTDAELAKRLFPEASEPSSSRRLPDLEAIHKEMARAGVTLRLLWTEYCALCRMANEHPLMYSEFCLYYQKFAETKRATVDQGLWNQTIDWSTIDLSSFHGDSPHRRDGSAVPEGWLSSYRKGGAPLTGTVALASRNTHTIY